MSIRFSTASLTLRSAALALALFAAVPAAAQIDVITKEARKDPFILVRLAALSLETPAEQGEALAGLVEAELARGQLQDAVSELKRISDGFWLATALVKLSDYQRAKKRLKAALATLRRAARALRGTPTNVESIALRRDIALRHAALGDIDGAIAVAKAIPERLPRIDALREIGRPVANGAIRAGANDKLRAGARRALVEASRQTRAIKDNNSEVARLLLLIGRAQTELKDIKQANTTLNQARRMILREQFTGRDLALAELAAAGFEAADTLLEPEGGFGDAFIQDRATVVKDLEFSGPLEITRNTLKPYASCLLTHPVIDAMRSVSEAAAGRPIAGIEVEVNPSCIKLAGKSNPRTGLEGKFSTAYCAALGLHGYPVTDRDFTPERVGDKTLRDTLSRVTLTPAPDRHMTSARVRLTFADGASLDAETALARGNPGNPMDWDDMRAKFMPLVTPTLGERGTALYDALRNFGDGDAMDEIRDIVTVEGLSAPTLTT